MTKIKDAKGVLTGYYSNHNASKDDLALIETYVARKPEQRALTRDAFRKWFEFHAFVREALHKGGEEFFYPEFQKYLNDGGEFVAYAKKKREVIMELKERIMNDFKTNADDGELIEHLKQYVKNVHDSLDHDEAIITPVLLQHYTKESYDALAKKYVSLMSAKQAIALLPWMSTRLAPEEEQRLLKTTLPLPMQWLYRVYIRPKYLQRIDAWKSLT